MNEKRAHFMEHMDGMRKVLITEPRGYPCQNADVIVPATLPEAEYGVLILEQGAIYPAMSGHNMICVATALLETGMVQMTEPTSDFNLETPAGLIPISAACAGGKAVSITLRNQPAFVGKLDAVVDVPGGVGQVTVDIAYGGMWYCVVDAASVGLELLPENGKEICRLGEMIKIACREQHPVNHPEFDYPGCDNMVFRAPASGKAYDFGQASARNTVVMSNGALDWDRPETWTGMIDRSPCGTGTCAVMAVLHARGELGLEEDFHHESIVDTIFTGRLLQQTDVLGIPAVVPTVTGSAWITQHCQVVVHPTDPFPEGYTVGDIWAE
jgi:proline racemase